MKMKIFSIYDVKTEAYSNPFYAPTPGAGIRTFGDAAKDPQSLISQHPADFHLYQIGDWDDTTGEISTHPPHSLGSADQYISDPLVDAAEKARKNS